MRFILFIPLLFLSLPALAAPSGASGLPIPRFVALKAEETNVRSGPGTRYPISWVYRRANMPVEVVEEYDYWRKIRDVEGTTGWVHKSMVIGQRMAMIKSKEPAVLRREPKDKASPLLKAEPMVVGKLVECEKDWCRIQISGRKGWIEKTAIWGVYPDEEFD